MNARRYARAALVAAVALCAAVAAAQVGKAPDSARAVDAIGTYCYACHGWATDYQSIMGSGRIVPGDPDGSDILSYIESGRMPPLGQAPNDEEIGVIRDWVLAGAPRP